MLSDAKINSLKIEDGKHQADRDGLTLEIRSKGKKGRTFMKNMMRYKGYYGSVNVDADDLIFYGKLEFIHSLISYEGETAKEIGC